MKPRHLHFPTWVGIVLVMPASADVIYSNFQNIAIPANFAGIYLDVNGPNGWNTDMAAPVAGWDINAFYGGNDLANSPAFQPVRANNTANWAPVVDLAAGATVGGGSIFSPFVQAGTGAETPGAPGYGTSPMLTTSGGNFAPGTEGYIGFKLYTGANYTEPAYGWMRVVLGGATPVLKDWAYDTSGGAIVTGNVLQSAAVNNAQTVTLTSASASFNLGSAITDTGGNTNSVIKEGAGTTVLTATNSYSGTTAVNAGKLVVNGTIGSSAVTVSNSGTVLASGASGTIGGSVVINNGAILAAGDAGAAGTATVIGTTTFKDGSIFSWDINSTGTSYDKLISASLVDGDNTGASVFRIVVADATFADTFWTQTRTWTDILTKADTTPIADWANLFTSISVVNSSFNPITPTCGSFSMSGNTLTWTAVPEPSTALAAILLGSGLLRRSRKKIGPSGLAWPTFPLRAKRRWQDHEMNLNGKMESVCRAAVSTDYPDFTDFTEKRKDGTPFSADEAAIFRKLVAKSRAVETTGGKSEGRKP